MLLTAISLVFANGNVETQSAVSQPQQTYSATDVLGRTVTLKEKPAHIMVVGKSAIMPADMVFLFSDEVKDISGLAKTNQGIGDFFPAIHPEFKTEKRLPHNISAEEVAAQSPDLVLTKSFNYSSIGKNIEQLGIPLFTLDLETSKSWMDETLQLGKLIGDEPRAQQIDKLYQTRIDDLAAKVATLKDSDKPTVLLMQFSSKDGVTAFSVAPDSWIQTEMIEKAGGIPVWKGQLADKSSWSVVSFEQIAKWNPDYIFVTSFKAPSKKYLDEIYSSNAWKQLKAVQEKHIMATPQDYLSWAQPISRWILCEQWLCSQMHPQLYAGVNFEDVITQYFKDFYGITDQNIINDLLTRYRKSVADNNR